MAIELQEMMLLNLVNAGAKCHDCGQKFTLQDTGAVSMPSYSPTRTEILFHHYPACPHVPYDIGYRREVAPSSNALAPSLNYNVDEGWE